MALSSLICWDVRTTGSDTNGGGFHIGSSGTDWSQQNAAQYSVTDGVTNGTTTITSVVANWGTDIVGNLIYISGGTGSVAANWYEVVTWVSFSQITVDRSTGLSAGTGVTLKVGGALATPTPAFAHYVGDNRIYIKNGTYTTATGWAINLNATNFQQSGVTVQGFATTHGDRPLGATRPILQLITNSNKAVFTISGTTTNAAAFRNLILDGNNLTGSAGIDNGSYYGSICMECKFLNFKQSATTDTVGGVNNFKLVDCEVTACTASYACNASQLVRCYVHDNTGSGVYIYGAGGSYSHTTMISCVIANNTGVGVSVQNAISVLIQSNVFYGNSSHGIEWSNYIDTGFVIRNNIIVNNGGYGITNTAQAAYAHPEFDGNAFYNNTSGSRGSIDDTSGINASAPYTNIRDVTLTGDPFTNAGAADFTLNNTAGAGAACRATGSPGTLSVLSGIGYLDMGAYQHADPASGGNTILAGTGQGLVIS